MKLLKVTVFVLIIISSCCMMLLPLLDPPWWAFIGDVIYLILLITYGKQISEWSTTWMLDDSDQVAGQKTRQRQDNTSNGKMI